MGLAVARTFPGDFEEIGLESIILCLEAPARRSFSWAKDY